MSWAEDRRLAQSAARDADRKDMLAQAEIRRLAADAAADTAIKLTDAKAKVRKDRKADAKKARAQAAGWAGTHMVEVLVYGLAVACALMAVPAMAVYGWQVYGPPGLLLPVVSEAGSWALAGALLASLRRDPDRRVFWLAVGVVLLAGAGGAMNLAHGWAEKGPAAGAVMAVVSVTGILVHQLAVVSPPRSRAQRAAHAERLAARTAVVELAADGTARLVHKPGLYVPTRRRLRPTAVGGLPTGPAGEADPRSDWDVALDVLDVEGGPVERAPHADPTGMPTEPTEQVSEGVSAGGSGAVGLLERPESDGESGEDADESAGVDDDAQALEEARWLARRTRRRLTERTVRVWVGVGAARARAIRDVVNAEVFDGESGADTDESAGSDGGSGAQW